MGTGLLTATGFDPKRFADVQADLEQRFREEFGQAIKLGPSTEYGKLIGIIADRETSIWERLEEVYDASYPGGAGGISLDRIAEITAVQRVPAVRSTADMYVRGSNVTIPQGSIVETSDTAIQFRTVAEIVLGAAALYALPLTSGAADVAITSITRVGTVATATTTAPHGLPAGAVVSVSGANEAPYNATAEIGNIGASTFDYNMASDPGGSATGTPVYQDEGLASDHIALADVTARSVAHGLSTGAVVFVHDAAEAGYNGAFPVTVLDVDHFEYTPLAAPTATPATGSYDADLGVLDAVEAVDVGETAALAGTLTVIVNPVTGWDGADSLLDATLGRDEETDAAFRLRRIAALEGLGNATVEAIRGALLAVLGVTAVTVFPNDTDATVSGRPPHSFEALVQGGDDQDVFDEIFLNKAAGIAAHGSEAGSHTDSQGISHTIEFSRPTSIAIYLDLTLTVNSDYPTDGDAQVEALVNAWGDGLGIGVDVVVFPYLVASFDSVPGITDVVVDIGKASSPSGDANIAIAETEVADFDSSRTTVTS